MAAAALVDQTNLASLRLEWTDILAAIQSKNDRFLRPKINRLAENLEARMNLADPELDPLLTVNQISTEITRIFRSYNIAIADDVHHYLPSKYKNPNKQNFLTEDSRIPSRNRWGGIDAKLLIEELQALPEEEIKRLPTNIKMSLYETITKASGIKNTLETDALENHYQLPGHNQRGPIRTPHPFPSRPTRLGNAYIELGKTMISFGEWINKDFAPPPEYEDRWIEGPMAMKSLYDNIKNVKYTLTDKSWFARDMYRIHQSKHGAAVKDKVETILCANCSILDRDTYEASDFVEMEYDITAPDHWRCPDCRGTESVRRGLTREQCGDKAIQSCPHCNKQIKWDQALSPIEARAIEVIDGITIFQELEDYYKTIPQKCIGARKVELGVDLSFKA